MKCYAFWPVVILAVLGFVISCGGGGGNNASSTIWLVSVNSDGTESNGFNNKSPAISSDGRYVAFGSDATNLVVGDTNNKVDTFVRDMVRGITSRVSVSTAGTQANGDSYGPGISSDGRYVAFNSDATNLVVGDTNNTTDIFVHDMDQGITSRVSVSTANTQANDASYGPTISSDGRYVAFYSKAINLVTGDTNGSYDIFVRDMDLGITSRVSVSTAGTQADGNSGLYGCVISSDGRYVAFDSIATNLVTGDTNVKYDIFVYDIVQEIMSRVSVSTAGTQVNGDSYGGAISSDGRYVAFYSDATDLIAGDTNNDTDIFVHDVVQGITSLVSVSTAGTQTNGGSYWPAISSDGRYVAFSSDATNLVADDTDGRRDIFVRDVVQGITSQVTGHQVGGDSNFLDISSDGRYVAFDSNANNLISGKTLLGDHIYRALRP
jgi:Tol biopolymer transport system component